jgi:hypothetical protein
MAHPAMANGLPLQSLEQAGHTDDYVDQSSQNRCVTEQGRHKIVSEQPDQTPIQCANDTSINFIWVSPFALIQNPVRH